MSSPVKSPAFKKIKADGDISDEEMNKFQDNDDEKDKVTLAAIGRLLDEKLEAKFKNRVLGTRAEGFQGTCTK